MFWCQASLLHHHALEVPHRPWMSVNGHACLAWGVRQLLGPLQSLHQVWVRSLSSIPSWIWVWLARVRASVSNSLGLRHHMGWGNAALLHSRVHGTRVVYEARCHLCSGGRLMMLLRQMGATSASCSIVAVEVKDFFWAFRLLRTLSLSLLCGTATTAAASIGLYPTFTFPLFLTSRVWAYIRHRARGH